ncbi:MAG: hydantoinase/oxoprolinase family protein [Pseudomonadota bacterium]
MLSDTRLAIDIGGTFTDCAVMRGSSVVGAAKALTTHNDPITGSLAAAKEALETANLNMADVSGVIHGTTLATNALIERKGARTACVLTEGFRDILEIAYERRYDQYDLNLDKPNPLVPRSRCLTIAQRHDASGTELAPLDESSVPGLLAQIDELGAEALAICFLHAYANPAHERRLRDLISAARPDLAISISSDVSPEAREFDRLSTTVANAYIQPLLAGYLLRFQAAFAVEGLASSILMMTAGGGMTTLETAARLPIRLVESGPAGGAILAARLATAHGLDQVLCFDMGGTTAKLCLIDGGSPQTARQFEIDRQARFIKGSGMPVRIPVIEMIEIGAGGGSIASVDTLGRLMVGPESAGSEPGPAGFGRGGISPTVTDADITMGLIDPAGFADRHLSADRALSDAAVTNDVASKLSLSATDAAEGISEVVDEAMASAGRVHAAEAGKDLSQRTMVALGGNGPLHATRVAERAGVRRVIVPPNPSVGSAVGFLSAPISFEVIRSFHTRLDAPDLSALNKVLEEMEDEARAVVAAATDAAPTLIRRAFLRYRGQGHEIDVRVPEGEVAERKLAAIEEAFATEYTDQFSRIVPGMIIEALNWSVVAEVPALAPVETSAVANVSKAIPAEYRSVRMAGADVEVAVHRRDALSAGTTIVGPALITEQQTTTHVGQGWTAIAGADGSLHLTRGTT